MIRILMRRSVDAFFKILENRDGLLAIKFVPYIEEACRRQTCP
jgi:hypothetical protein